MKKTVTALLGILSTILTTTNAHAACGLYEQHHGAGPAFQLEDNTSLNDFRGIMISRRSWHGHLSGWHGKDRNFNDEVSSIAVSKNCSLEIYAAINYAQAVKVLPEGIHNLQGEFDNSASSAVCRCGSEVHNSKPITDASGPGIVMESYWRPEWLPN
jgi:hypothetical protein